MKNLYQLSDSLTSHIKSLHRFNITSQEINEGVNRHLDAVLLTDSGKKRYPDYFGVALRQVSFQVKNLMMENLTTYAYKYGGEFYLVDKKLASELGHKNTRDLEQLLPLQAFSDSPEVESGYYYIDNMKPYFVNTGGK